MANNSFQIANIQFDKLLIIIAYLTKWLSYFNTSLLVGFFPLSYVPF